MSGNGGNPPFDYVAKDSLVDDKTDIIILGATGGGG